MTRKKLRYAQSLMADSTRSIPEISREVSDLPPLDPLYHNLNANGTLKGPGQRLPAA